MRESTRTRVGLLAASVAALVFLIAVGSSRSSVHVGEGRPLGVHLLGGNVLVVLAVLPLVALGAIAYAFWGRGGRTLRREETPVRASARRARWWQRPLVAAVAIAAPAAVLAALILIPERAHERRLPAGGAGHGAPAPPSGAGRNGFDARWWAIGAIALGAGLAAAVLSARARGIAAGEEEEPASELDGLREAVDVSLAELEREPDPRRAVIRAYAGMEGALARHGLERRPSEAPFEYLARSFAHVRGGRAAGVTLTSLFQQARFSRHAIDDGMKQEAIAALVAVRRELEPAQ